MNIKANQFFNPETDSPFEVLGFFEEYIELKTEKRQLLGWRKLEVDAAPRALGSDGRVEKTLIQPIVLRKGLKDVEIKASISNPLHVVTMVQPLCGKLKDRPRLSAEEHNRFPKGRW